MSGTAEEVCGSAVTDTRWLLQAWCSPSISNPLARLHTCKTVSKADSATPRVCLAHAGVVLVLGATAWQRRLICQELSRIDPGLQPPADISADVPAWQRLQLYRPAAVQQQQQQEQAQGQQGLEQQGQQREEEEAQDIQQPIDPEVAKVADGAAGPAAAAAAGAPEPPAAAAAADEASNRPAAAGTAAAADAGSSGVGSHAPKAAAGSSGSGSNVRQCAACFVTTRILVVDLLSSRLLPEHIAGGTCCCGV